MVGNKKGRDVTAPATVSPPTFLLFSALQCLSCKPSKQSYLDCSEASSLIVGRVFHGLLRGLDKGLIHLGLGHALHD